MTEVDGQHVITGYVGTRKCRYDSGATQSWRDVFDVSEFELNPRFPDDVFTITSKIADGTRAYAIDDPNVQYEWRDGDIRKCIDQKVVHELEQLKLAKVSGGRRFVVWLNVALLLCLAGGAAYVRFRRKSR